MPTIPEGEEPSTDEEVATKETSSTDKPPTEETQVCKHNIGFLLNFFHLVFQENVAVLLQKMKKFNPKTKEWNQFAKQILGKTEKNPEVSSKITKWLFENGDRTSNKIWTALLYMGTPKKITTTWRHHFDRRCDQIHSIDVSLI